MAHYPRLIKSRIFRRVYSLFSLEINSSYAHDYDTVFPFNDWIHFLNADLYEQQNNEAFPVNHCSPHVRDSKTVSDSGFHAVDSGFQVLHSSLFQWNLDSGLQSLVDSGFLDLFSEFQSPGFQIPHTNISKITESGFLYTARHGHQIALCRSNCEIHLRCV